MFVGGTVRTQIHHSATNRFFVTVMSNRLSKYKDTLNFLVTSAPADIKQTILSNPPRSLLLVISEICYNVRFNIPVSSTEHKRQLRRYKDAIVILSQKSSRALTAKKRVLKRSGVKLLSILIPQVLKVTRSLLNKKQTNGKANGSGKRRLFGKHEEAKPHQQRQQ